MGLSALFSRGRVKLKPISRQPLPPQLSTPFGSTDYRQLIPAHDYTGNQGLQVYWFGNQVPTGHIQTPPHAWYTSVRAAPVELQRRGISWQGRVLSSLDSARLTAAMRASWQKLGSQV